jgi:hydrogenase expression/formation protein HypC
MCLAVPMKIISIEENGKGAVDLDGVRYEVNLSLIEAPHVGDYVIVHAGFAIEKLDSADADERLGLFEDMARIYRENLGGEVILVAPPRDRVNGK